jgi:hypothetical protein
MIQSNPFHSHPKLGFVGLGGDVWSESYGWVTILWLWWTCGVHTFQVRKAYLSDLQLAKEGRKNITLEEAICEWPM